MAQPIGFEMFDIGFAELIIIALVGLVVIGPERLPEAARTAAKFLGRAKRTYSSLRRDLEQEIGADEIRRELYNEAILEELKQTREELNQSINWDDNSEGQNEGKQPAQAIAPQTAQPSGSSGESVANAEGKSNSPKAPDDRAS